VIYIGRYILQLFKVWITWLFLVLDAVGLALFVVAYFEPSFVLPRWTFWVFIGVTIGGFIGTNVKLFADQQIEIERLQNHIAELQATEANIYLEVISQEFSYSNSGTRPPFPINDMIGAYGFKDNGLPGWASYWAEIEARNIGRESGELEWNLDRARTQIPSMFIIDDTTDGLLDLRGKIEPREKEPFYYYLYFKITEEYQEPRAFAKALHSLDKYQITLNYWTKRITGPSEVKSLCLLGDFQNFRQKIVDYWKNHIELRELSELAETG
jgi:hypothetical protein